jgi:O-antigen ligase
LSLDSILTVLPVVLLAAVAPLLPPVAWKVNVTLGAALLLGAALYLRARVGGGTRSPLDLPVLCFLAAAGLATAFSPERLVSFFPSPLRGEGLMMYAAYGLAALAAARLTREEKNAAVMTIVISGSLVGIVALAQYYGLDLLAWAGFSRTPAVRLMEGSIPIWSEPTDSRSYATLGHPIFLGGYLVLLLPIASALALASTGAPAWASGAATMLLFGGLVASSARAAWVAAIVGAAILVRVGRLSRPQWRRAAVLAALLAALSAVMTMTRPEASLGQRAASTFDVQDRSLRQRLYFWKHTVPLIAERPLLGWGFSALMGRFPDYGSPEYLALFGKDAVRLIDNPHNELLHLAFSTGLVGLAAYLWVWAVALAAVIGKRHAPPTPLGLRAALTAALAAYFVWMQLAWSTVGPANVFWVVLGLAASRDLA